MATIAFQGELGAFSEVASREYYGSEIEVSPSPSFADVFRKVSSGRADAGMIPIENSLAGSVHENYDHLLESDLQIVGELKLRIIHNLIVHEGVKLSDLKTVTSHPQALAQCRDYLGRLREVRAIPTYDTAGAVRDLKHSGSRDTAAIASAQAAADYGLSVIASGIESNHKNYTRFLAIEKPGKITRPETDDMKISIAFALRDAPGALFKALAVFALRDINLMKIESRPLLGEPWQYLFYLDFAGKLSDTPYEKALDNLQELSSFVKVLGNYSVGRTADGSGVLKRPTTHPVETA